MGTKAKVITMIAMLLTVFSAGVTVEHWRMDIKLKELELAISQASEKAVKDARKLEQQRQSASDEQAQAVAEALARVKPEVIVRKVTEYVESPSNGKCELNDDWLQLHNEAARKHLPSYTETFASIDGADNAFGDILVTDKEALQKVTSNYLKCASWQIQVDGWQNWYKEVLLKVF